MQIPLTFGDTILVFAVTTIVLMITTELSSPYYGQTNLLINRKRLKTAALTIGLLFLTTVAIRVYMIMVSA